MKYIQLICTIFFLCCLKWLWSTKCLNTWYWWMYESGIVLAWSMIPVNQLLVRIIQRTKTIFCNHVEEYLSLSCHNMYNKLVSSKYKYYLFFKAIWWNYWWRGFHIVIVRWAEYHGTDWITILRDHCTESAGRTDMVLLSKISAHISSFTLWGYCHLGWLFLKSLIQKKNKKTWVFYKTHMFYASHLSTP